MFFVRPSVRSSVSMSKIVMTWWHYDMMTECFTDDRLLTVWYILHSELEDPLHWCLELPQFSLKVPVSYTQVWMGSGHVWVALLNGAECIGWDASVVILNVEPQPPAGRKPLPPQLNCLLNQPWPSDIGTGPTHLLPISLVSVITNNK